MSADAAVWYIPVVVGDVKLELTDVCSPIVLWIKARVETNLNERPRETME